MNIKVFPKDTHDLYTTPLLQQTAYWSAVKSRLGFIPLAFELVVREKKYILTYDPQQGSVMMY